MGNRFHVTLRIISPYMLYLEAFSPGKGEAVESISRFF